MMNNSTRFAVPMPALLVVLAGGAGSARAGGNQMGGTGLCLTHSAETHAPGALMRSMVKAGIGFDRMRVVTQGEMKPKVLNKDAHGMALNRRVLFSAL